MDYPLENLLPDSFQELVQALLVREYKNVQCFPVGQADGGRDAVAVYDHASDRREREFLLFQVKFSRNPAELDDPNKWLEKALAEEVPKVEKLILRGAKRYILITNVRATSPIDTGRIDVTQAVLDRLIKIPAQCWWREDIARRLDSAWAIKWAYPQILTTPDIIRAIFESGATEHAQRRTNALTAMVSYQWNHDRDVRFKQIDLQTKLSEVFIDSPVILQDRHNSSSSPEELKLSNIFSYVFEQDVRAQMATKEAIVWNSRDRYEDISIGAGTFFLRPEAQALSPRAVIEGAPGQGKSTVTQYLCQVHRIRLLNKPLELAALPASHQNAPVRLPFRIDLRDFATWLTRRDPFSGEASIEPLQWAKSLESFLAALVRHCSGGAQFDVSDIQEVARISSLLLVFDGLDEVADIKARTSVVEELNRGISRLHDTAASLQVIITSRPAAFAKSPGMPREGYTHFKLVSLPRPLIMEYATKWANARGMDPREQADVIRVLKEKLDMPHLRDLARNPMQLAILLSLISSRGASLPDKRTALYDAYMDLFFNRESEKSVVVREHRDLLYYLHGHLAWILHSEAETKTSTGRIPLARMQDVIQKYLADNGYATEIRDQLFRGLVERVVALVSRVQGTYEFEVQPLREYFAARYLYNTAPYSPAGDPKSGTKPDRFIALAPNLYWLNVTRFFAGCYTKGELPSLIDNLKELRDRKEFSRLAHPRTLAATLLSDWVFSQHPRSVRETVSLILDRYGLRYMIADEDEHDSSSIVLGDPHAREELIVRCWAVLESSPPRDFAFAVVNLMRANSERRDTVDRWEESLRSNSDKLRWLEYGLHFGHLPEAPSDLLNSMSDTSNPDHIRVLVKARQYKYLETNLHRQKALRYILDGYPYVLGRVGVQTSQTPLMSLANALNQRRYNIALLESDPRPLKLLWNQHFAQFLEELPSAEHDVSSTEGDPIVAGSIRLFLTVARQQTDRPAAEWATSLAPWDALVECGRKQFGDQWALYRLAVLAAGIRSVEEKAAGFDEPLDNQRSLCRRARYARLRSGNEAWWRLHLEAKAGSHLDLRFLMLLCFRWATGRVLKSLSDILSTLLDSLSQPEWESFYSACAEGPVPIASTTAKEINSEDVPETMSIRLATVLVLRASDNGVRTLFHNHLRDAQSSDRQIATARMSMAFNDLLEAQDWQRSLKLLKEAYVAGAQIERGVPYQFRREARAKGINQALATLVCDNPEQYPVQLVRAAERRLLQEAMKHVEPLQKIAKREHWFDE